jgi:glyoxylase-like metal-dependent hydrolase (beta-lactamase superfamily II)
VKQLAEGLWRWTARHPEWHPEGFGDRVSSYAVHADDVTLLIDPLVEDEETFIALDDLAGPRVAILITIPYHARSAESLAERYNATVYGHEAVAKRLSSTARFSAIDEDSSLPGEAQAFAIGRPRRYEMPLWLPSHRALVFGDAVVEADGELRVWVQSDEDSRRRHSVEKLNPTLRPLVDLDPEAVLVTHGEPVLSGGAAALDAALVADPWYLRPS